MSVASSSHELLPAEKRQLLERLLREKAARPKQYKLSFGQERLWLVDRLQPGLSVYNLGTSMPFAAPINIAVLRKAINEIARRHEVLRTRFALVAGEAVQIVEPSVTVPLAVVDLTAMPASTRPGEAQRLTMRELQTPFDLTQAPLVRFSLLRVDADASVLVFAMHHIVSDGWSLGLLMRELGALYEGYTKGRGSPLPPLPIQYGPYAEWQRRWLQGETLDRLLAYWTRHLQAAPALIELPSDRPRPPIQSYRGAWCNLDLPEALCDRLRSLGRWTGATLYMILLAAFQTLLLRYTGQTDIVIGTPIANRVLREHEALIGLFANMLVIRADLAGNPSWLDLLGRVREVMLEAHAHQDLPFERLVEALRPARHLGYHPVFQVMFAYQNIPLLEAPQASVDTAEPTPIAGTTRFDLSLFLQVSGKGLRGTVEYSTDLFDHDRILRMIGHFRTLLEAVADAPEQRLWDLPLLPEAERRLLTAWNATTASLPNDLPLPRLFEHQAAARPDAVAVAAGAARCTYGELDRRANQVAHHLVALGVGPEALVGLCLDRSVDMVVGLLAILKAGGAYLPLDPSYPADRLAFMLSDGRVPVLLTRGDIVCRFAPPGTRLVHFDADRELLARQPVTTPDISPDPANLAYVIYTSGSTGVPKGVQVTHEAFSNLLQALLSALRPGPDDRLLALTTLSFDIAALEIFLPLIAGAQVIIVGRDEALDGRLLANAAAEADATMIQATPATWRLLTEAGWRGSAQMTLLTGGESLAPELADRLQDGGAACWNLYGPTEVTIYATAGRLTGTGAPVSIGRPITNLQAHVLDRFFNRAPIGVPGDLFLGGVGLARGYLNQAGATAERFVPDPFGAAPGGRLYRTGDVARYRSDGRIEYLGRSDFQVKIRGFRIEPGEVEAVLRQHPAVRQAVVVARCDAPGDSPYLAAYAVPQGEPAPIGAVHDHLKSKLADYMLPSALVWLNALPLTPNGKIDRHALPAPDQASPRQEEDFRPPCGPIEQIVAAVWMDILNLDRLDTRDDFFALGGHSLIAARVMYRLSDIFQIDLPLLLLFKAPNVAALSRDLASHPDYGPGVAATAEALLQLPELSGPAAPQADLAQRQSG
jgi:amino acid adenylation domain-containing protein